MKQIIAATVLFAFLVGCGDSNEKSNSQVPDETNAGALVYAEPDEDGNSFACETCHALSEPAADGIRRAGHAIGGATRRASFKNGQVSTLLEAVNSCRVDWMNASVWTEDSSDFVALREFLDASSGGDAEVSFTIVDPPTETSGGDADNGQSLFNGSCSKCHGDDGSGTTRGPALAGRDLDPELIVARVRKSGSDTSEVYSGLDGGRMPFWSAERLNDSDLLDIVAFVVDSEVVVPSNNVNNINNTNSVNNTNNTNNTNPNNTNNARECDATHAKIGQTMVFSNKFHDVGGTAEIIDDCTIEISDFRFDGGGIVVQVYGGLGGNYADGFPMTENLVGDAFDFVTLTVNCLKTRPSTTSMA